MKKTILILIATSAVLFADQCADAFTKIQYKKAYQLKYLQNDMYEEELKVAREMQNLAVTASIECAKDEEKAKAEKYLKALRTIIMVVEENLAQPRF